MDSLCDMLYQQFTSFKTHTLHLNPSRSPQTTYTMTTKTTRIGVLLLPDVQLLDASPIDLFGMLTPSYLTACSLPQPIISGGQDISIHYISESATEFNTCTANAALRITDTLLSETCKPGELDMLLIPGPDPRSVPSEEVKRFVRGHARVKGVVVLTVCTGVYVAGYAGILDGRRVTGPRGLLGDLERKFGGARWEEKRWVRDVDGEDGAELWTSGESSFLFCSLHVGTSTYEPIFFIASLSVACFLPCLVADALFSGNHKWAGHGRRVHQAALARSHGGCRLRSGGCRWKKARV